MAAEAMIGDALGDSTLTLGLWAPERNGYVDTGGAPLELPRDSRARGMTEITRDDRPAAVLIHDPMLDTDSGMVVGLAATSLMLLENTRLVEELQTSRSRVVETADRERRRLERDLHDGAQQRLMAVQIKLRMAQEKIADDGIVAQLETIGAEAAEAVEELRTLAHGIYPPVLRSGGLVHALRSLAMTAPIAISVTDDGIGRCSPSVEAAVYFCSAEAVQNAIKHAGGKASIRVTVGRGEDRVHFAISDDGVGIDHPERGDGDGLIGMRDRVGAVGASSRSSPRLAGARRCAGRSRRRPPESRALCRVLESDDLRVSRPDGAPKATTRSTGAPSCPTTAPMSGCSWVLRSHDDHA